MLTILLEHQQYISIIAEKRSNQLALKRLLTFYDSLSKKTPESSIQPVSTTYVFGSRGNYLSRDASETSISPATPSSSTIKTLRHRQAKWEI